MSYKKIFILILCINTYLSLFAQKDKGILSGSFQTDFQYYTEDSVSNKFNTRPPDEKMGSNAYLDVNYQISNFRFGIRYETYMPALLGYPDVFNEQGIANRFVTYNKDDLEVTVGNFYEQFGSGTVLRSQEQRQLGLDNSFDGIRLKYYFQDKAKIVGLIGTQRDGFEQGAGEVKGLDAEIYLNKVLNWENKFNLTIGGSYVSKFQQFEGVSDIPKTVDAIAGRMSLSRGGFRFETEYAFKGADPGTLNGGFVEPNQDGGDAILVNAGYSQKGLAILLGFKKVYNMDFRSERSAIDNRLQINFVPVNTTQHTYRLLTLYPYATQVLGEYAFQADLIYTIPKRTTLGGKYGTTLTLNYALARNVDTTNTWQMGEQTYFQDFNFEISRKWSKKWKTTFKFVNLEYDAEQIEGRPIGIVKSNTFILDVLYKLNRKNAFRMELQHLQTEGDRGSWAFALLEYTMSPHWSFFISDELNYGQIEEDIPVHYYNFGGAYTKGANRFSIGYGRQRFGLICVGGICRIVPPYSGLSMSITSRF